MLSSLFTSHHFLSRASNAACRRPHYLGLHGHHFFLDHGFDGQVRSQRTHVLQPARVFAHLRLPTTLALSRTPVVQSMKIASAQQTPIARGDLAVSLAHEPRGKQCIIRLQSSLLSGSLTPGRMASVCKSRDGSTFIHPYNFLHCWCLGDREMLQEAWGLVPDGVRVLLVEAESKLMELKYPGAREGGASDGASDLLGVSVLRADTHEV